METDKLYEQAVENGRLAEEEYVKARELVEEWKNTVKETHEEARQILRDSIRPRNINFDSAARHKPLATPKDNMKKAPELLTMTRLTLSICEQSLART